MHRLILISSLFLLAIGCASSDKGTKSLGQAQSAVECSAVDVQAGSFCSKPLGKPEDECAKLGLDWSGVKDDDLEGQTHAASVAAFAAIVKGGRGGGENACPRGESSYRVYVGVSAGDVLQTGNGTGVSHVTYCTCTVTPPPPPVCGNGIVEDGEQCDDGNQSDDDQCTTRCTIPELPPPPVCGNGQMEQGEACDDGNTADGDGCSSTCVVEELPPPPPVCGNGELEDGEQCDDGNTTDGDGCSANCTTELPPPPPACDGGECVDANPS